MNPITCWLNSAGFSIYIKCPASEMTTRFAPVNARFNGSGMSVHVGNVGIAYQNERRDMDLVQAVNRRRCRASVIAVRHILWIRSQQRKQTLLRRIVAGCK